LYAEHDVGIVSVQEEILAMLFG